MTKIQIVSDFGDGRRYVDEKVFWSTLDFVRTLIGEQRNALRSHDRDLIASCKSKENALLKRIGDYESERSIIQTSILDKIGAGQQEGGAR